MTKIRVTKRFIADAIESEARALRRGSTTEETGGRFVNTCMIGGPATVTDPRCTVCAVGSVVVRVLDPRTRARTAMTKVAIPIMDSEPGDWIGWHPVDAISALKDGQPLRALSIAYEQRAPNVLAGARAAAKLARSKRFPSHVVIDIDGLKPRKARGLTVVRGRR